MECGTWTSATSFSSYLPFYIFTWDPDSWTNLYLIIIFIDVDAPLMRMDVFAHYCCGGCDDRERHMHVNHMMTGHLQLLLISTLESQSGHELGFSHL